MSAVTSSDFYPADHTPKIYDSTTEDKPKGFMVEIPSIEDEAAAIILVYRLPNGGYKVTKQTIPRFKEDPQHQLSTAFLAAKKAFLELLKRG
jgi:hypothetical protein